MDNQGAKQLIDPILIPFIEATDESQAQDQLDDLVVRVTPLVAKITNQSSNEDGFQQAMLQVIKSLRDCKADPAGKAIRNYEHYVSAVAANVRRERLRDQHPEQQRWKEFLEKLWAEIEQLKPLQRSAYLLNLTDADGGLNLFVIYGVTTIQRIGATLQLSDEQFARLWPELKLSDEDRRRADALKSYDEKFALLWQHLPLEDKVIARMLDTNRQQVITQRMKAHRRLARTSAIEEKLRIAATCTAEQLLPFMVVPAIDEKLRIAATVNEADPPTINHSGGVELLNKRKAFTIPESRIAFYLFVLTAAGFIFLRALTDQEIVVALGTLNIAIIGMWVWALISKIRSLNQSLKYDQQNEPE